MVEKRLQFIMSYIHHKVAGPFGCVTLLNKHSEL